MNARWLAVLIVIMALATLALVMVSKGGPRELRAGREQRPAVRRFGRRKGEPRPVLARRHQRTVVSE